MYRWGALGLCGVLDILLILLLEPILRCRIHRIAIMAMGLMGEV